MSHDREFLNSVVTDIIEINNKLVHQYRGNYDAYILTKEQEARTLSRSSKKDQRRLQRSQRRQNTDDLSLLRERRRNFNPFRAYFRFFDPPDLPESIIEIQSAGFAYQNGNVIFRDIDLNVSAHSRIGIIGPNGSGKSTLMDLMLGNLTPTSGEILRNRKLRSAKFSQHSTEQLELSVTPVSFIQSKYPEMSQQEIRNKLGGFGLKGKSTQDKEIRVLSGGQKSRLALLEVALTQPHVLFLDEPTNHLDLRALTHLLKL